MSNSVEISIVTVGMNHLGFLKEFYSSLFKIEQNITFEAIYIDNCSKDSSVKYLEEFYPMVRIHRNEIPKGFSENNNIGCKMSNGKYLAILNPDIIFIENSLDKLYQYYEKNIDVGILVPKLLNRDGTVQSSIRRFMSPSIFFRRILSRGNDEKSINYSYLCKDLDISIIQQVNWAVGAAFFISKELFEKLNGFDEDFFLYVEDEELCLRCWKIGERVIYFPETSLIHNHIRSSKKVGKLMFFHFASLFKFWYKHGFRFVDHSEK